MLNIWWSLETMWLGLGKDLRHLVSYGTWTQVSWVKVAPTSSPLAFSCFVNYVTLCNFFDRLILTRMFLHWRYIKAQGVSSRHKGDLLHPDETTSNMPKWRYLAPLEQDWARIQGYNIIRISLIILQESDLNNCILSSGSYCKKLKTPQNKTPNNCCTVM